MEGRTKRCVDAHETHGLVEFVRRVVEMRKTERTFRRLQTRYGVSCRIIGTGDQLTRDIEPAQLAGLAAVHDDNDDDSRGKCSE